MPGNLFTSAGWCRCYDDKLSRFFIRDEGGKTVGGFIAYNAGVGRVRTLITPPYSPHIGLFVLENRNSNSKENSFRKQVIDAIADFLRSAGYGYYKLEFAPEWNDMQPMIWKKISAVVRYTYRIDLKKDRDDIISHIDSKTRNMISKAEREFLQVDHRFDVLAGLKMITHNLSVKKVFTHNNILENIIRFTATEENGLWSTARQDGHDIAINVCVHDRQVCYNLLSAIDRDAKQNYAGTFSLYSSILKAKDGGLSIFDFEGSSVPEIERFFRSFGGELTSYFTVTGGKWPWPQLQRLRKQ